MPSSIKKIPQSAQPMNLACAYPKAKGVGLIEILIAVVLVSVGFLAAAKMQSQGLRFGQNAYNQAQAYFMLSDMMDRMRSNMEGVELGAYDGAETSSEAVNPGCNESSNCSVEQLAEQDLFDWSAQIHPLRGTANFTPILHGSDTVEARAVIEKDSDSDVYTMSAFWVERIGNQDTEQKIEIEFMP